MKKILASLTILIILMPIATSAFSFGDLMDALTDLFAKIFGDNPKPTTTTTIKAATSTTSTTLKSKTASTTTVKKTSDGKTDTDTSTVKSTLTTRKLELKGVLVDDMDAVFDAGKKSLVLTTRDSSTKTGYFNIIDWNTQTLKKTLSAGAQVVEAVDPVLVNSLDMYLAPTKSSLAFIKGDSILESIQLSGEPEKDVDLQLTSDEKLSVIPVMKAGNTIVDVIDVSAKSVKGSAPISGKLKVGVDCILTSDSRKAICMTDKSNSGVNVNFINPSTASLMKDMSVDGSLVTDVDAALKSNDEELVVFTNTRSRGLANIVEAKAMSIEKRIGLNGRLVESLDGRFLMDERYAFACVNNAGFGYIELLDVTGKRKLASIKMSGAFVPGVDVIELSNGFLLAATQRAGNVFIDYVDVKNQKVVKTVYVPGRLRTSVDMQLSESEDTIYLTVVHGGGSVVHFIDLASMKAADKVSLKGVLVNDLDVLYTSGGKTAAVYYDKGTAHMMYINGMPGKALTVSGRDSYKGHVTVINLASKSIHGQAPLEGAPRGGVDNTGDKEASTSWHPDEDYGVGSVVTTTSTTTTTWWWPTSTTIYLTTTTIPDDTSTTTIQDETTTTVRDEGVITPRCGDGYLSWHGTPGGGSEECDPNTGPHNNWDGARRYDCPPGLDCVDCKCVGCGDGRLQDGEDCDQWLKKVKIGGVWLWEGDLIGCDEDEECVDCECVEIDVCQGDLHEEDDCAGDCNDCETCSIYGDGPCYYCKHQCPEGWSSQVSCNSACENLETYEGCEGCYRCTPNPCSDLYVKYSYTSISRHADTNCVNNECTTTCTLEAYVDVEIGNAGGAAGSSTAQVKISPSVGTATIEVPGLDCMQSSSRTRQEFEKSNTVSGSGSEACATLDWWASSYTSTVTANHGETIDECGETGNNQAEKTTTYQ